MTTAVRGTVGFSAGMPAQRSVSGVKDLAGALSYQNPVLVKRFAARYDVSEERATQLFEECKKFMIICILVGGASPSHELDEMWHHFILHTRDYIGYCERYLGRYLHHNPTETPDVKNRNLMLEVAKATFGSIEESMWPKPVDGTTACSSACSGDNYCSGDD